VRPTRYSLFLISVGTPTSMVSLLVVGVVPATAVTAPDVNAG
jgi:hypothetical protein